MSKKILVTYASKAGATAGIAEAIGAELQAHGHDVDVLDVNQVKDLTPYDVVVLGSALYMRRWRKDAVRFLRDTDISTTIEPTEHRANRRPETTRSRKHATRPPAGHFLG